MEEHDLPTSPVETASALSAAALRELQQRAEAALSTGREQATRLEADITRQIEELSATLNAQLVAESGADGESGAYQAEVERLTAELFSARDAWLQERKSLESQYSAKSKLVGSKSSNSRQSSLNLAKTWSKSARRVKLRPGSRIRPTRPKSTASRRNKPLLEMSGTRARGSKTSAKA